MGRSQLTPASDELMGRAYEAVGEYGRALIKQALAGLYYFYAPSGRIQGKSTLNPESGQGLFRLRRPVPSLDLLIGQGYVSYPRLLAAAVPAVCCGVREIRALVQDGEQTSPWILAALELCGVEEVYFLPADSELPAPGEASFSKVRVELGRVADRQAAGIPNCKVWTEPRNMRAGIWQEPGSAIDCRVLTDLHPDIEFFVYSPNGMEGAKVSSKSEFTRLDHDVVYAPAKVLRDCVRAWLGLGPGMERTWLWPEILDFLQPAAARLTRNTADKENQWIDPL
ncbi:MAG: histidinol dehydrogenase [Desulfonatronovibrionaceae bacterium]